METNPFLEAHFWDITSDGCILLMATTQSLLIERTLSYGLLKSWTLHLIHMHWAHTWKMHTKKQIQFEFHWRWLREHKSVCWVLLHIIKKHNSGVIKKKSKIQSFKEKHVFFPRVRHLHAKYEVRVKS